jgi:predicted GNAT family acetyltransferase
MEIRHDKGTRGQFYVGEGGKRTALLDYYVTTAGDMNITHTQVGEELSGKGIGKKLVAEAVGYAREHGMKVIATCPFAAKVIAKTPEFQDVLAT